MRVPNLKIKSHWKPKSVWTFRGATVTGEPMFSWESQRSGLELGLRSYRRSACGWPHNMSVRCRLFVVFYLIRAQPAHSNTLSVLWRMYRLNMLSCVRLLECVCACVWHVVEVACPLCPLSFVKQRTRVIMTVHAVQQYCVVQSLSG